MCIVMTYGCDIMRGEFLTTIKFLNEQTIFILVHLLIKTSLTKQEIKYHFHHRLDPTDFS